MRTIAMAAAALMIAADAVAADFYLQGDIGGDFYGTNELDGDDFDIGPGGTLAGRIGIPLSYLRGELEFGFSGATIDVGFDPGDDDFSYYQISFLGGAYADVGPVYFGAGGGLVYQEIETEVLGVTISDSETNPALHGELGLALPITETVHIVPHYRATWLPGFDLDDEVIVHSARLGLRLAP